jgi:DNA ligase-associated metallophosphoesterase
MPASVQIEFGGQQLILLGDRAVHWPARQTLVLADVHLGKDASFRAAGVPVPAGNSSKDLARIESLLLQTSARRLVILGDLIHSKASHQPELAEAFTRWRNAHKRLEILLIRGNHDRRAGPSPADWHINQYAEPHDDGPFNLSHYPQLSEKPLLCGHVHPTVAIRDFDGSCVTMPCFVADPCQLMFPAFGSFTGGHKMHSVPDRRIYAVMGKLVIPIPMTSSGG